MKKLWCGSYCISHFIAVQGDVGVRRARYEARWHAFVASAAAGGSGSPVAYAAVPWLSDQPGGDIEAIVFYGTSGAAPPPPHAVNMPAPSFA